MIIIMNIVDSWASSKYLHFDMLPLSTSFVRFLLEEMFSDNKKQIEFEFLYKFSTPLLCHWKFPLEIPSATYLKIFNEIPRSTISPDQTYWIVNGLVKNMNDIMIDRAFRNVVTESGIWKKKSKRLIS